jgi:hypothetical protein
MSRIPFLRHRRGGVGVLSALIFTALAGIGALALNLVLAANHKAGRYLGT